MRKTAAALITLSIAALALAGCSSGPSFEGSSCGAEGTGDLTKVATVSGELGSRPEVKVKTPAHEEKTTVQRLIDGGGSAITDSDQLLAIDLSLYSGRTGERIVSTEYNGDLSRLTSVTSWSDQYPGIGTALKCATEGSRLVAGIPVTEFGTKAAADLELEPTDTVITVIDVTKVYLPHAEGAEQYNDALGLPTVVRAPNGRPGIIVPEAKAPKDLVVQTLIKGDGEKVTGDAPVRLNYTGVTWAERKVFDSSWGNKPVPLDLSQVIPGFAEGLKGQTVGSQVLIVVPPEQAYGDAGQGQIPPNSTLVFVVDILGVDSEAR
ncbi:peptidylprolyl isomerase [Microbacterium resistens]|uniref:Peptidyl-prolyl cis-trans isomerase n=1 Tax=Microbacterium resistens TaxID=156977 RepID=A0ABU1SF71_9MICO|nr:FKBP-type peptidyl-prolyl cis-trans isomerase [Microbacterium resistens]MDR6868217.1 peptidylprolyl isomerase [Microbacterium resistens]